MAVRHMITAGTLINSDPAWSDWLRSIGVPIDEQKVKRVIIHLAPGEPVVISYDINGDERLIGNPPPKLEVAGK